MAGAKDLLEGAKWAWENRQTISQALATFRRWWKRSRILIIGPGGTGKTTLARVLSGEYDWLKDSPWRYNEDVAVKRYRVKGDSVTEVIVPPGQEHRRPSTWPGIGKDLAEGKYSGVILISANGHHSLSQISYKHHHLFKGNKDRFISEYLAACRADEVSCLRHLTPYLAATKKKLWLMSVVAKQDLWAGEESDVLKWYRDGEYGAAVNDFARNKPAEIFRRELIPVSFVISNFTTDHNEMLVKNVAGYDHRAQVESVRRLIEFLDGLRKWEART